MRIAVLLGAWTVVVMAQNPLARPDPFVGAFQGDGVTLEMARSGDDYAGTLSFQWRTFPAAMKAYGTVATGSFELNGQDFPFTLTQDGTGYKLASAGTVYRLARKAAAAPAPPTPPTPPTPPAPPAAPAVAPAPAPAMTGARASDSIVGSWRNATSSARFNADGTGVVDSTGGRYEIRGNQLTLTWAQGQAIVQFEVRGDVLWLTVNGATATLDRVKEEAGEGSVHTELVGKWCWISATTANQGAGQSSRCLTLNGNGTYTYAGAADSYNPYGGASSQAADSGTWTATEATLTTHSRGGKTTTYRLEKRNHPKNVRDPMIVLDGQPYVTALSKPPW
jgi:hypothetical protein